VEINIKKSKRTKNERWVALLNRQPVDRIPVFGPSFGFAAVNAGLSIVDFYNNPQKSYDSQMRTAEKFGFQEIPFTVCGSIGGWEFGGEINWPSSEFAQAPTVRKHPVETPDDVMNLKVPDVKTAGIVPIMTEIIKLVDKSSSPYICGFVSSPFNTAGMISGVDKLTKWMLKKPDAAHRLLRLATDFVTNLAQYWADEFGAERIIAAMGEPSASNQVISPKQFEQFALPYIKEACQALLSIGYKHIFMHICGEQNLNLPYWTQIPFGHPGMVSFGHEVDLETAAKYFPNDIIMGNIEPVLFQTGKPEQVYEAAKVCIEKGKRHPGGFILASGCEMPPMASEENVWAMMQAVSDLGWYE
jgi:uroporphyrinogen decarboxylase